MVKLPALAACLLAASAAVHAETVVVDGEVALLDSAVARPGRGLSMAQVEARFGTPANRHATVGAPPITRWDYDGFSVYFEFDKVIHAVATSA